MGSKYIVIIELEEVKELVVYKLIYEYNNQIIIYNV